MKSLGFQDGAGRQQFMTDPEPWHGMRLLKWVKIRSRAIACSFAEKSPKSSVLENSFLPGPKCGRAFRHEKRFVCILKLPRSTEELKLPFGAYLDAVEACERGHIFLGVLQEKPPTNFHPEKSCPGEGAMPYYLGKVPLRAELPELAEEVSAAISSPQEVQLRTLFWEGEGMGVLGAAGVWKFVS